MKRPPELGKIIDRAAQAAGDHLTGGLLLRSLPYSSKIRSIHMHQFTPSEKEVFVAACRGDEEAFSTLVEPHRQALIVHCYRLSGSLEDAEDIVQETYLRAWHKLNSFQGTGSFRNWLYVIATRLWFDEARRRKKQVLLPLDGLPADPNTPPRPGNASAVWLDPLPNAWLVGSDPSAESSYELRETVSLAFMVALQKLNPRQRVVLILRKVFNWPADEVADVLGLTVASVNNLLYRARKNLEPASYQETMAVQQNLDLFVTAWETGDVPALIDLLHETATFAMPPFGVWYAGKDSIHQALQNFVFMPDTKWKLLPTGANGRTAFGIYQRSEKSYQAFGLIAPIFRAEDGKIIEIVAFLSPQLFDRFNLPPKIG